MCTVSFLPIKNNGFILTSSRDENMGRPTSSPITTSIAGTNVLFPMDLEKGGTWIASGDNGLVCCLLNGGFIKHKRKPSYEKSRGKIILEAFEHKNIDDFIRLSKFEMVEPFTIIFIENYKEPRRLLELRWDGRSRHISNIDISQPHIWSSVTLYGKEVRKKREEWFSKWISEQITFNRESILSFHCSGHTRSRVNDIEMERSGGLRTVSITQVIHEGNSLEMYYVDRINKITTSFSMPLKTRHNNLISLT